MKDRRFNYDRGVVDEAVGQLDGWIHRLGRESRISLLITPTEGTFVQAQFAHHEPEVVMFGKCLRLISGFRAAMLLASAGFSAECGALIRILDEFTSEVFSIASALDAGEPLHPAVAKFVEDYFVPVPRSTKEKAARDTAGRTRYVSRRELAGARQHLVNKARLDGGTVTRVGDFLNTLQDSYVHGGYESSVEMFDFATRRYMLSGSPHAWKRQELEDATIIQLYNVIVSIELTAKRLANAAVADDTRQTRKRLEASGNWSIDPQKLGL